MCVCLCVCIVQSLVRTAVTHLKGLPMDMQPTAQNCRDQLLTYICAAGNTIRDQMRDEKGVGSNIMLAARCAELVR